jgi:protein-L-isoaspartate(D-aspartate) O-methyltransferase
VLDAERTALSAELVFSQSRTDEATLVLAQMGLAVTRLDPTPENGGDLTNPAGQDFDGSFDVVICEGAVTSVPPAWCDALALGGRLGVVQRTGPVGRAELYLRSERDVGRRDLFDAAPPVMPGFEAAPAFTF